MRVVHEPAETMASRPSPGSGRSPRQLGQMVLGRVAVATATVLFLVVAVQIGFEGPAVSLLIQLLFAGVAIALLKSGSTCRQLIADLFGRPRSYWGWVSIAIYGLATLSALGLALRSHDGVVLEGSSFWGAVQPRDLVLVTLVLAPVCEELFFRGMLLGSLVPLWGRSPAKALVPYPMAVYLCAMIFLLFHLPVDLGLWRELWGTGALPLNMGACLLGLWAGSLVIIDRSLWTPILAHAVANLSAPAWSFVLQSVL